MTEMTTGEARAQFADLINRVAYGKERVILTRRGRRLAAIIPLDQLEQLQAAEDRAARKPRRTK